VNGLSKAPGGFAFEGRTAGREKRSRTLSRALYHEQDRAGRGEPVFARTAKGWLPVGHIEDRGGCKVLAKEVDSKRHRLRRPEGYALEGSVVEEARERGVSEVEIRERDTGRTLRAALDAFDTHGLPIARAGFAPQVVLPLARWQVEDPRQAALFGKVTP